MIKIYTDKENPIAVEVKKELLKYNLNFEIIDVSKKIMNKSELMQILTLSNKGIYAIISKESEAYQKLSIDFSQTFHLNKLIEAITKEYKLLKLPFVTDAFYLQTEFDEEAIKNLLKRNKYHNKNKR